MKILLIEDEVKIAEFACQGLSARGLVVDHCADGHSGFEAACRGGNEGDGSEYSVIVLDIMLPGRDGLSVLKGLRQAGIKTPVILLTARNELDDRIEGLNLGADDYLAKPFLSKSCWRVFRRCSVAPPVSARISCRWGRSSSIASPGRPAQGATLSSSPPVNSGCWSI